MKKEKANHIGTILLTILLTLTMPLNVLASTTSSGAVTIQEQWANNVYNNFQTLLQDSLKVSIPKSEADEIWNNYIDHAYSIWNLNENDLQSHYGHFRNYVGSQFEMEKNADNTYNYNMSQDAQTFIQDSFNTYVSENDLGYTQCYLYSYSMVNVQQFPTYALYSTFKEWASKQDGYILTNAWIGSGTTQGIRCYVIPKRSGVDFVGTTSQGSFTNVQMYIDWTARNTPWQNVTGSKIVQIANNGTISEFSGAGQDANTLGNTSSFNSGVSGRMTIFTNLPKNEMVYVFKTLNALKAYNSGSPQPYYTATGYTGLVVPNGVNVPNTNGSYESIVNNIQSGWTAQEVLALVDRIMSQNGGSGSGSGDSSSDNPFGFLGRIGELLSQLVTGVGELLTGLVDGVVNVFLGAEDENGERHGGLFGTIKDLISQLSTIFSTDISQFVSDIFGWLPSEIITLWTAGIMIAILFGILRIIRG